MKEKEYESLRIEILQWQTRRITIYNAAIFITIAYVGWMLALDNDKSNITLSWQVVSIFPLIVLSISMHMQRLFEFYMLKVATYLAVYHESIWENEHDKVATEKGFLIFNLNVTNAIIFFSIGVFTTIIFYIKFTFELKSLETIIFLIVLIYFLLNFIFLLNSRFNRKKAKLICKWEEQKMKLKQKN